jgi:hypothetical protein
MDKVQALRAKILREREEAAALKEYFNDLFPEEFKVSDGQFRQWVRQYGFDNALTGFEGAVNKLNRDESSAKANNPIETAMGLINYASKIMSNEKKKDEAEEAWEINRER